MAIISLVAGVLSGGGLSLLTKGLDLFDRHLDHKQNVALKQMDYAHELLLIDKQSDVRQAEIESELEIAMVAGQAQARTASYEHDASYGKPSQMLTNILRLFRPALTLVLLGVSVWAINRLVKSDLADATLIASSVEALLYLTSTATAWWFGDRTLDKASVRN